LLYFNQIGCNAVCWAPATSPVSLLETSADSRPELTKRLVSGGCDTFIKIWKYVSQNYLSAIISITSLTWILFTFKLLSCYFWRDWIFYFLSPIVYYGYVTTY